MIEHRTNKKDNFLFLFIYFLRSKIEYILLIEKSVTSKNPAGYIDVDKAGYSYSTRGPATITFSYKIVGLVSPSWRCL